MSYGLPYMGSKNTIANKILNVLPSTDVFVDIFAGGCAMTHAAMLSKKYKSFVINDISDSVILFAAAVSGKYSNENKWVSRECFNKKKNDDPYIRYLWSFGNKGENYMYGEHIEEWKHALWNARVLGDMTMLRDMGISGDVSKEDIKKNEMEYKNKYIRWYYEILHSMPVPTKEQIMHTNELLCKSEQILRNMLRDALRVHNLSQSQVCDYLGNNVAKHYFGKSQCDFPTPYNYGKLRTLLPSIPELEWYHEYDTYKRLQRLQRLQMFQSLQRLQSFQSFQSLQSLESLHRLQRLQSLQSLQSLQRFNIDYRDVPLPVTNAIIYADPPYRDMAKYGNITFDHEAFYNWCERQTLPVYISEYDMPRNRFKCIAEFNHLQRMNGKGSTHNIERLFVPIHQQNSIAQQLTLF